MPGGIAQHTGDEETDASVPTNDDAVNSASTRTLRPRQPHPLREPRVRGIGISRSSSILQARSSSSCSRTFRRRSRGSRCSSKSAARCGRTSRRRRRAFCHGVDSPIRLSSVEMRGRGWKRRRRADDDLLIAEWMARRTPIFRRAFHGPLAEHVLFDVVEPFVRLCQAEGWIDKWFFVRYHERGPHLRLRLHGSLALLGDTVVPAFERVLRVRDPRVVEGLSLVPDERAGGTPRTQTAIRSAATRGSTTSRRFNATAASRRSRWVKSSSIGRVSSRPTLRAFPPRSARSGSGVACSRSWWSRTRSSAIGRTSLASRTRTVRGTCAASDRTTTPGHECSPISTVVSSASRGSIAVRRGRVVAARRRRRADERSRWVSCARASGARRFHRSCRQRLRHRRRADRSVLRRGGTVDHSELHPHDEQSARNPNHRRSVPRSPHTANAQRAGGGGSGRLGE